MKDAPQQSVSKRRSSSIVTELTSAGAHQDQLIQNPKKQNHEDPFWSKEAQTISELPKILSIFYNDDGKLKRISYILNFRDHKSLDDIISEIKSLLEISNNRRQQNGDENSIVKWKLYNLNGQLVKTSRDLYFQIASSFLLCKNSTVKLPPVFKGNVANISVATESKVENGEKKVAFRKIPLVHQSRPSSVTDFLQRKGQSFKPHVTKQEMGWMFGSSHLRMDDPGTPTKRKRKTRSISPNSKTSKPPTVPHKQIVDKKVNPSSAESVKEQSDITKSRKVRDQKTNNASALNQRSRSVDGSLKIASTVDQKSAGSKTVKNKEITKKKKESNSADTKLSKKKMKTNKGEELPAKKDNISATDQEVSATDQKVSKVEESKEVLSNVIASVDEPNIPAQNVDQQPEREKSVILVQSTTLPGSHALFVEPYVTDIFGVNIPNPKAVRRGSVPLKSWMIPVTEDDPVVNKSSDKSLVKKETARTSVKKSNSFKSQSFEVEEIQVLKTLNNLEKANREKTEDTVITHATVNSASVSNEKSFDNDSKFVEVDKKLNLMNSNGSSIDHPLKRITSSQKSSMPTSTNIDGKSFENGADENPLKSEIIENKSQMEKTKSRINKINSAKQLLTDNNERQASTLSKLQIKKIASVEQNSINDEAKIDDGVEIISIKPLDQNLVSKLSSDFHDEMSEIDDKSERRRDSVGRKYSSSSAAGEVKLSNSVTREKTEVNNSNSMTMKESRRNVNLLDELFPKSNQLISNNNVEDE